MSRELYVESHEGVVWVWEHSRYPESSVLAGQTRRSRVAPYDTVADALADYPAAVVSDVSSHGANQQDIDALTRMPTPAWFDPDDAGEEW
jgi:hypothetical protein